MSTPATTRGANSVPVATR
jgi:hypothetical protein